MTLSKYTQPEPGISTHSQQIDGQITLSVEGPLQLKQLFAAAPCSASAARHISSTEAQIKVRV